MGDRTMMRGENSVEKFKEFYLWLAIEENYSDQAAGKYARRLAQLFPLLQERFDHWFHTRELKDDLRICGWSIGEIVKHTECSLYHAFLYFDDAFSTPWSWEKTDRSLWERNRRLLWDMPSTQEFFRTLGWKEEEDCFPAHWELVRWFTTYEHNSRVSAECGSKDLIYMAVRPLMERFSEWWTTGSLRDDLEVGGWSVGRLLNTYVRGVPVAFSEFNYLFFDCIQGRVDRFNEMAQNPALYQPIDLH
ncbi:hypothetical protein [Leptolyngbya sp. GGD]|uniref:hypothetical protein n=1 Tax=Leptolyngbya sp. GGD TaxID=2997907 RepID=UPI00227C52BB|nr:hypothetical protein [Leptolyngbya sp. GGD]MCY6494538.1 hypothetical protein [Leptolyngbya sp. GGD]